MTTVHCPKCGLAVEVEGTVVKDNIVSVSGFKCPKCDKKKSVAPVVGV
jgi:transposase-like protein